LLKTNKKHGVLFFFLKLILFAGVVYLIYAQLSGIDEDKWKDFSIKNPLSLILAVILVVPNMWMVFMSWKITLKIMGLDGDKQRNIQSFFAGLVTGMLTPNMAGNFIGRLYYFDKKHRGTITFLTVLCNYAQMLATLIFGTLAILWVDEIYLVGSEAYLIWLVILSVTTALAFYFFFELPLKWFKRTKFLAISQSLIKEHPIFRWKLLSWSLSRNLVFTCQSALMLHAFGETLSFAMLLAICQIYFIAILVPSLFLGKLGVKEVISIGVLSTLGMNEFSIIFASLCIWFVNSLAPAALGLIMCNRSKEWN
jgi:uncharacterized membrane protein YbhN (UPF0104 family)